VTNTIHYQDSHHQNINKKEATAAMDGKPELTVLVENIPQECSLGKLKSILRSKTKLTHMQLKFDDNNDVGGGGGGGGANRTVVVVLQSVKGETMDF